MHRCIMCDEADPVYIPDDIIDDYGIYSCGSCGFEIECARSRLTGTPALDAGYQPTDSVVMIPFADSSTVGAMRFDLPSLVEPVRLRRGDGCLKSRAAGLA